MTTRRRTDRRHRPTRQPNPNERGLGYAHQRQVAWLKAQLVPGTPCWWCGLPMFLSQPLAGDHTRPRSRGGEVADRLLHLSCNASRGDGSRDDQRPALTRRPSTTSLGTPSRQW